MLPGKLDLWYDFLAGSASPSFQHVAKTLKMAEVSPYIKIKSL